MGVYYLLHGIIVDGIEILVDEILPELDLGAGEKIDLALAYIGVLDPVGIG